MQIEIKAEDVEKIVREELIKAGLGKVISDGVAKALSGHDSPTEAIVAAIRAKVTPEIIRTVTDTAVSKMVRAAEDRY